MAFSPIEPDGSELRSNRFVSKCRSVVNPSGSGVHSGRLGQADIGVDTRARVRVWLRGTRGMKQNRGRIQVIRRARPAFTLIELVMSLVIISMFAAVAVPRYANFTAQQRCQGAVRRIVTDLAFAKRRAQLTGTSQSVTFSVVGDFYTVVGLDDPDHPGQDYVVSLAAEPYLANVLEASLGGDKTIIFDGFGMPDSGGTIRLRIGAYEQTITIDGTGSSIDPSDFTKPVRMSTPPVEML